MRVPHPDAIGTSNVGRRIITQIDGVTTIRIHNIDFQVSISISVKQDLGAIRGPSGHCTSKL